ncbi:MAG: DEAD/DEAH box helicase [Patescibacteria group bacterium]|nr:DEAD/DEAH box helicase [Patescibacteria group bacterium]
MSEEKNETLSFNGLGIAEKLLETINKLGLSEPTPIQFKSIPVAVEGKDIIGVAQTGTGKTLAFAIPMIQRLALYKGKGLVLLPTRELALQVDESMRAFGASIGLRTAVIIGGESINRQREMVRRNPHVLIATPGRMNDFIQRGWINLSDVKVLVLDEADMMLDMGFAPQIETIIKKIPKARQTMLFSATMPKEIIKLAANHMAEPISVEVAPSGQTAAGINQEIYIIHKDARLSQLEKLLQESAGSVLIFCRTKRGVKKLTEQVEMMGHRAAEIHSNRSLEQRRKALAGFKSRKYRVLVATDIAARGIDVKDIELVVNFDLPEDPGDYVHRIGRTGRAGKTGKAISFAMPDQIRDVRAIERLIKKTIPLTKLAEYNESSSYASAPARHFGRKFSRPFNRVQAGFAKRGQERFGYKKFNHTDQPSERGFSKYKSKPADNRSDFGNDKFKPKREGFRSDFGHDKFKAKKEGYRSDFGRDKFKHNKPGLHSDSGYNKFAPHLRRSPAAETAAGQKRGFDPLEYFSNRPETRVMTDKERFRASLREGDDRPSFGRKKNFSGKGRRDNRFHR